MIYGDTNMPVMVQISNMDFTFRKGTDNVSFIHACNYDHITLDGVSIKGIGQVPLIKTWSKGTIEMKDVKCTVPEDRRIVPATEKFFSRPI